MGSPAFIIPKKDGSVRFISDFRELNKRIKQKPFSIPKIQDLLLKLESFQYGHPWIWICDIIISN